MAGDIKKQIRFEVDIEDLRNSLRNLQPMFRELESQLQIRIPIQTEALRKSSILDPSGQPFAMPGKGIDPASMEKLFESSKGLNKKFGVLSDSIDKFQTKLSSLTEGGEGGNGAFGGIMRSVMGALTAGGLVRTVQMAVEIPMERMAARAAAATNITRDIAARLDPTQFENIMRMDPTIREEARTGRFVGGMRGLLGGPMLGMAAGGAAIGSMVPGVGTAIGGLIGGGLGLGYNVVSGGVQRGAAQGYEEAMASLIQAQGPEGQRFRAGFGVRQMMNPFQQAFMMGDPTMSGLAMGGGGMNQMMRQFHMTPEEMMPGMMGMGMFGRGAFTESSGSWAGSNNNVLGLMARMARGTGLGTGEISQGAFGLMGAGTMNMSPEEQMRRLEEILARGTARGYDTSALSRQLVEGVTRMAGTLGGTTGAGNIGVAEALISSTGNVMGMQAVTPGAAGGVMDVMQRQLTATGGVAGLANKLAADRAVRAIKRINPNLSPAQETLLTNMLARGGLDTTNQNVMQFLAVRAGVGMPEMQNIVSQELGGKFGGLSAFMPGGIGMEDPEAAQALYNMVQGRPITEAVLAAQTQFSGGFAGRVGMGGLFAQSAGEVTKGEQMFTDAAEELNKNLFPMLTAARGIEMMDVGLGDQATTEMGARVKQITGGKFSGTDMFTPFLEAGASVSKFNTELGDRSVTLLKQFNDELQRNLKLHGAKPADDKTPVEGAKSPTEAH